MCPLNGYISHTMTTLLMLSGLLLGISMLVLAGFVVRSMRARARAAETGNPDQDYRPIL